MSRDLPGWTERHSLTPGDLRVLADALEALQTDRPLVAPWSVDVVAHLRVWDRYETSRRS